jgi:Zn-dependent protease with chaperone function
MALAAGMGKDLLKTALLPLVTLFLLPALTLAFLDYASPRMNGDYLQRISSRIDADNGISGEQRQAVRGFLTAHPPSTLCEDESDSTVSMRAALCRPYSQPWQFALVRTIATATSVAGAVVLVVLLALVALSFIKPHLQARCFVAGWHFLMAVCAVEVLVQGGLAVWLSFWVTASFTHQYSIRLVLVVGLLAASAALLAIISLFRRVSLVNVIAGVALAQDDAPRLWQRIATLAAQLGSAPPDHIVAGIDTNFFITESQLKVGEQRLLGRSLFVSLPLLRMLSRAEADAVLAHELAHLRGGDTSSSALLGPKLLQFEQYCAGLRSGGVTVFLYYLLRLYRVIFEFALRRESRAREFRADHIAASVSSASGIAHSLIKLSAYASYRISVEQWLFTYDRGLQGELGIANTVAEGLPRYVYSGEFLRAMHSATVPHPFDSHPPLAERIRQLGLRADTLDYSAIAADLPQQSWVDDIVNAPEIEGALWRDYELQFAALHEQGLAYRYEPADDQQRAVVTKHFPAQTFHLSNSRQLEINHAGLRLPDDQTLLVWDAIADARYDDGALGSASVLRITHPKDAPWYGATRKIKLPGLGDQKARLLEVFGHYQHRHRVMRQFNNDASAPGKRPRDYPRRA